MEHFILIGSFYCITIDMPNNHFLHILVLSADIPHWTKRTLFDAWMTFSITDARKN
ncbi:hypothetical protein ACVA6G_15025 [Photobacterium damselae]